MCGITGIIHFDGSPVSSNVIQSMTDVIMHRGPDGEGIYCQENIAMGNRRLAILDLSEAGKQPMFSLNKRHIIVYNGELYNYQTLRAELMNLGHQFSSNTDTEVILNSYIQWGRDCLNKFNGMFAFSIYDNQNNTIFIARDRYGIKPLYYSVSGNTFTWGSEVKSLINHPQYKTKLNHNGLIEYFTFQNFLSEQTLFDNITLMPAGHFLYFDLNNLERFTGTVKPEKYWEFMFQEPQSPQEEDAYIEELQRLFEQAVKRQLTADVELGSYLSSGMDSGSITAIANKNLDHLNTFTVGFDTTGLSPEQQLTDESNQARQLARLLGTDHHEKILPADNISEVMDKLIWHLEEPRMGQSTQNFYAAELAGNHNKVVLSGAGGDELFAGYPWRYYRAVVNHDFNHFQQKYYGFWQRLLNKEERQKVFSPINTSVAETDHYDTFTDVLGEEASNMRPEDYVNQCLTFEAKTFLHGLLVLEDKLSMANSLEARVPFLDNELVDFAMNLPAGLKLGNLSNIVRLNEFEPGAETKAYYSDATDGKQILRKAMHHFLPPEFTDARKQGFSPPDISWDAKHNFARMLLTDKNNPIYTVMNYSAIQEILAQHGEGITNRRSLIWSLVSFTYWCRRYL